MWKHGPSGNTDPFQELISLTGAGAVSSLTAGFAYASLQGAIQLRDALNSVAKTKTCKKSFYIGLHHGITEPGAIRILRELENSTVYLFCPTDSVTEKSLISKPLYHPKYCYFRGSGADYCIIGSANLTSSAVGVGGHNIELCVIEAKKGAERSSYRSMLNQWDIELQKHLKIADNGTIEKYAKARLSFLEKNKIIFDYIEPPIDIALASDLFIQVGAGSGIDRHQVEFNLSLAKFFGTPSKSRVDFTLSRGTSLWFNRPLTPKKTTFGVDIYRLGMPTVKSNGEEIAHRAIRFKRTSQSSRFEFEIDDVGGQRYKKWLRDCNKNGHLGQTSGGRIFGYVF